MNKSFEQYNFPGSKPKKVLIPRVIEGFKSEASFQLKLDFGNDSKKGQKSP
ncbi:hypothetical protein [Pseudalkalibacillus berkeleyi]|uniref:Uncharacterized protein n=1 Tax=Pseudalkalibacillus berkeleyi TaxID=1069813 RepID=A0ABS9H5C8_9BACL|nr:hypothetical protein [Pseudalkalibacillus berkeleyi]MCF6139083.1 hypothetical protein [Pseudalkalibacillus berkeleyi]